MLGWIVQYHEPILLLAANCGETLPTKCNRLPVHRPVHQARSFVFISRRFGRRIARFPVGCWVCATALLEKGIP